MTFSTATSAQLSELSLEYAQELIRTPGTIQPHGILFVFQEPQLTILQVSQNTFELRRCIMEYEFQVFSYAMSLLWFHQKA